MLCWCADKWFGCSAAELSAQAYTYLWAMQANFIGTKTITVHYDSTYASGTIDGSMASKAHSSLIEFAKGCLSYLRARFQVMSKWVQGHSGDPWNEMADSLCSHAKRHSPALDMRLPFLVNSTTGQALQFANDVHDGLIPS